MANEFKVKKGLIVNGSGSTILDIQGSQGQLFSVTDQLSGSLFSVNDISGIPVMEVFSDDTINMGTFGAEALIVSGSTVTFPNLPAGSTDTDKFVVLDSGVLKYRTGTQLLSDIGAQASLTNPVTGTGTTNYLPKFTGASALGNSLIYDNGTNVGIGTTSPSAKLGINGNLSSVNNTDRLKKYSILPGGYIESDPINFRFDESATAYAGEYGTITFSGGTTPSTTDLKNLFTFQSGYINLNSYKDVSNNLSIELSNIALSNSANTSWKPYIFFHAAGRNVGTITIELKDGADNWATYYSGPSSDFIMNDFYRIPVGVLKGVRYTFSGITGNSYLRMIGVIGKTVAPYVWNVLKSGGDFYGNVGIKDGTNQRILLEKTTGNITTTGNVGIGTTSPSSELDVYGTISLNGFDALRYDTTSQSLYAGHLAGNNQTRSNAFGYYALQNNTGNYSNGFGHFALRNNTGNYSNGFGYLALNNNTGISSNGFGYSALHSNTGDNSNGFGYYALQNNTGNSSNGFGLYALQNNQGNNSNGFGHGALKDNTGANSNGFGYAALENNTGISSNGFGYFALGNNTGDNSNGFGLYALQNNQGNNSNGFGYCALRNNTGDRSNGFGNAALRNNQGNNNTAIGHTAGYETSALTGTDNTFLGYNASYGAATTITNSTAVGANVTLTDSNTVILGNGANVGIGTTSPSEKLEVNGNIKVVDVEATSEVFWGLNNSNPVGRLYAGGQTAVLLNTSTDGATQIAGGNSTGDGGNISLFGSTNADPDIIRFRIGAAEAMRVSANGNVGIGTTSPTSKLHVTQAQNNTFSTAIAWTASANDVLNITNDNSTDTNNYASLYIRANGSSGNFSSRIVARNTNAGTGELHFQLRDSAHTANTETKLMIDSGGNVGIGTTSPSSKLDVAGTISLNGFDGLRYDTTSQGLYAGHLAGNNQTRSNAFGYQALSNNTGTYSNGFGNYALRNNTGSYSNGFGYYVLQNNTGDSSSGFGHVALSNNTGNSSNGFGYYALSNNTGNNSNGFGSLSLSNNTGNNSNGFGYYALKENTGASSNGFGFYALRNNTGGNSSGFGHYALENNTGANSNGFGFFTLRYNQGDNNTAIGGFAGYESTPLTGTDNTFLGYNASYGENTTITNSTAVGANVTLTDSNTVILGNGTNVGIGTTSPSEVLTVEGNISGSSNLIIGQAHTNSATLSTIAGGSTNTINSAAHCSFIGSGYLNTINSSYSTIVGGCNNTACHANSHVIGSSINSLARDTTSFNNTTCYAACAGTTYLTTAGTAGEIVFFGTGTTTPGNLYYYNSSGVWTLAKATSASSSTGMLGIAVGDDVSAGILLRGHARYTLNSNYTGVSTIGAPLYISTTGGGFTQTAPSGTGDIVRIIGYVVSTTNDQIYFCPDNTWVKNSIKI